MVKKESVDCYRVDELGDGYYISCLTEDGLITLTKHKFDTAIDALDRIFEDETTLRVEVEEIKGKTE